MYEYWSPNCGGLGFRVGGGGQPGGVHEGMGGAISGPRMTLGIGSPEANGMGKGSLTTSAIQGIPLGLGAAPLARPIDPPPPQQMEASTPPAGFTNCPVAARRPRSPNPSRLAAAVCPREAGE
jgi:hypothetical protein